MEPGGAFCVGIPDAWPRVRFPAWHFVLTYSQGGWWCRLLCSCSRLENCAASGPLCHSPPCPGLLPPQSTWQIIAALWAHEKKRSKIAERMWPVQFMQFFFKTKKQSWFWPGFVRSLFSLWVRNVVLCCVTWPLQEDKGGKWQEGKVAVKAWRSNISSKIWFLICQHLNVNCSDQIFTAIGSRVEH